MIRFATYLNKVMAPWQLQRLGRFSSENLVTENVMQTPNAATDGEAVREVYKSLFFLYRQGSLL